MVWLEATNIKTDWPMKKLDDKRYGPFKIKSKVGSGAYRLTIPWSWKSIHPVFNKFFLSLHNPPLDDSKQKPTPPPPLPPSHQQSSNIFLSTRSKKLGTLESEEVNW